LRLRFAGAWIASVRGERAAISDLHRLLTDSNTWLQAVAAHALIQIGASDDIIEPLLEALGRDELMIPGVVLAWGQPHPSTARPVLERVDRGGNGQERASVAFIVAALGDRANGEFLTAGVTDLDPRVRIASIWALGVLGIEMARANIAAALQNDASERAR